MILEQGNVALYEIKAQEYIEEATRIRYRLVEKPDDTLLELYREKMKKAILFLSLAASKMEDGRIPPQTSEETGRSVSG